MSEEEQSEWPSFEAVLRDVAPSDVAQRTQAAISSSRRALSHQTVPLTTDALAPANPHQPEPPSNASQSRYLNLDLPAPLAPLQLDTSAVRALLEPRPERIEQEVALDALSPLPPVLAPEPEIETALFNPEPEIETALFDPEPEVETALFDPEPEVETASQFDTSPFDSSPFETSPFDTSPFADASVETASLASELEDTLSDVPGIELPNAENNPVEIFDDLELGDDLVFDTPIPLDTPAETTGELDAGSVFELGEAELSSVDAAEALESRESDTADLALSEFSHVTTDLFDLVISSEEIESDRLDLHGPELYSKTRDELSETDDGSLAGATDAFDSVATANEIEGDLSELSEWDSEPPASSVEEDLAVEMSDLDNVVQLRPDQDLAAWQDDSPETVTEPPPNEDIAPRHSSWVGLDTDSTQVPEPDSIDNDPWAHMRPDEEPKSKGFWSRIPKFFSGDGSEKPEKNVDPGARVSNGEPSLDISFDSACPNCGGECQVDLDDPIGRRVHVSCPACDHMWFTAYTIDGEDSQTG